MSAILLMIRRSLRNHLLSTSITAGSLALASGLVMAVFTILAQTSEAFIASSVGYDAVLGARGSQLQLVLNSVYHLETSPGNIPWSLYQTIKADKRVELAVPYALGDNYKGFRLVGTSEEIFTRFEYAPGKKFKFQSGRPFKIENAEVVVGSYVAQKTGLVPGMTINPYHGLNYAGEDTMHAEVYTIVGVLEPTNTPSDRVLWMPIEGVFRMGGHVLRGTGKEYEAKPNEEIPDEHKEVSSVMLKFTDPRAGMALDQTINKQGKVATLAWPIDRVLIDIFDKLGWMNRVLMIVACLSAAVGAGSILASIYNTMNERRREFAILRSLGARRTTLFAAIVGESTAIALMGIVFGFLVYAVIFAISRHFIREATGVVLDPAQLSSALLWVPLAIVALGALSGLLPAWKAYSTDVASNLSPLS